MAEYTVGLVLDVAWTSTIFVVSGRLQVLFVSSWQIFPGFVADPAKHSLTIAWSNF